MHPLRRRNLKIVLPCIACIGIMLGLVAYSPTLYRLFCAATGYGGTTQRADSDSGSVSEHTINVQFDTNVAPELPWRFEPVQREVKVHLGEQKLVFFTAENLSDQEVIGHASFNVTPQTTGIYFNKIQCFCFDDERLNAHEKVDMPVVFFVDPALANDPETRDVDTITLSYTFFRTVHPDNPKDLSRFTAAAEPDPVRGQQLFEQRCAACHGLDINKAGPKLGGVFGRKAGSAAGYSYSPALSDLDVHWSADNLERWLTDPSKFKSGTKMPVRVIEPSARRDIIAYLQEESRTIRQGSLPRAVAQSPADSNRKTGTSPEVRVRPDLRVVGHVSQ
ncbi:MULTISPECIES: cytochrome c oxidase assembly protein [unclassified Bradyrhizobium]|uniref:cytochrome c oxidase assembly protein n=1 Tax=unclassified Bradyrhizobium TaxID=2631580 RepID=UPI002479AF37|nr:MULTISPECIES: cytochrome c oxidase assembly protein [unclassified Bradyrhizobium]